MSVWRVIARAALFGLIAGVVVVVALTTVRVDGAMRPQRQTAEALDFESVGLVVREVRFAATDGVELAGWLLAGQRGRPAVVLCHDWGSAKHSLINLAIEVGSAGFPVLLFDFRGHGESDAARSTFGVAEKRDVLGAADFLAGIAGVDPSRIGVYGVGMGAHATVLAAADRRSIRAVVLDGLYPDAGYSLARHVFDGWSFGVRELAFLPVGVASLLSGVPIDGERADDRLRRLADRDVLLLAPARDAELAAEMERMYEGLTPRPDVDGNLVVLPTTLADGLYGEDRARHHDHVVRFMTERLKGGEAVATRRYSP